jgi:hypothetical protein
MSFLTTDVELADALHDAALNAGELSRQAPDESLDSALARVGNRLA